MNSADISLVAFAACNALRIAAYLPQMVKLARSPAAAHAFCFATWALFTAANLSTAMYAAIVLGDGLLVFVHVLCAACCCLLMGLAWWRRHRPAGAGH